MAKEKEKIGISKMNHPELMKLLADNPEVNINSATLVTVLREFHKYIEKTYDLKEVK